MKEKKYKSDAQNTAWSQVIQKNPEFKGLNLPDEGRIISGRKHATSRFELDESGPKITWVHIVVVGLFSLALVFVLF